MTSHAVPSLEFQSLLLVHSAPSTIPTASNDNCEAHHPSSHASIPASSHHALPDRSRSSHSARRPAKSRPTSSTAATATARRPGQVQLFLTPKPPTNQLKQPQAIIHSMLQPDSIPKSSAQKWQTYDSPSGRLREMDKLMRSKRVDPYRTHWQASTESKQTSVPATTGDYVSENSRLLAHQTRLQQRLEAERIRLAHEREMNAVREMNSQHITVEPSRHGLDTDDEDDEDHQNRPKHRSSRSLHLQAHAETAPTGISIFNFIPPSNTILTSPAQAIHQRAIAKALHMKPAQGPSQSNSTIPQSSNITSNRAPPPSSAPTLASTLSAASLDRKARMLRIDAIEAGENLGEELVMPKDDEDDDVEEKKLASHDAKDHPVASLPSPVAPSDVDTRALLRSRRRNRPPSSDLSSDDDDDDVDDTMAAIDATLSLAHDHAQRALRTGSGKWKLTKDDFQFASKKAIPIDMSRLDTDHPYHQSDQALLEQKKRRAERRSSTSSATSEDVRSHLALELSTDAPLPPSTVRLYPPALLTEMEEAHRTLGQFIQKCQADTKFLRGDPKGLVQVYWNNFQHLLTASRHDHRGNPIQPTDGNTSASSAIAAITPPHLTLCASYLLVKICESGIYTSYQSDLLMQLLNTLLFAVYDVAYEEEASHRTTKSSSSGNVVPSASKSQHRIPFYTRYKHLQLAFQDVDTYRRHTDNRLKYTLRSLHMVISHSNRRFAHLCFRAWLYEVKISKKRDKIYRASLKEKSRSSNKQEGRADDMIAAFFFWRAYAKNHKMNRLLTNELTKLRDIHTKITQEANRKNEENTALAENLQMMCVKLLKLEESRLSPPLKPDEYFSNPFMELLLKRCAKEIEAMRELGNGFIPLYKIAPKYKRKYVPSSTSTASSPPDFCVQTDQLLKQLSFLSRKGHWETRTALFTAIELARSHEEDEELRMIHELSVMDIEDFLVIWVNHVLDQHPTAQDENQTGTSAGELSTPSNKVRKLRDLSNDLRDSTLYMQLLQVLGPELPSAKVEKLFDLHSKAKLILSLSAMMGTRILLSEFEYVEGIPDLHLLFIGSIWSARHGLGREPKQKWFDVKENRLRALHAHWHHLRVMDRVPEVTAYSFMGHLFQLSAEIDLLKTRLLRRAEAFDKMKTKVNNFMWRIQRARMNGNEEEIYHPKHINSRFHNYSDSGTIDLLLNTDPARIKHRLKYEHKQLGQTAGISGISHKQRRQLVLEDEEEIEQEVQTIKRLFATHRVELKKIQKHYCTDSQTNEVYDGIDFESFLSFAKDCGFLTGNNRVPLAHLHDVFHACINMVSKSGDDDEDESGKPSIAPSFDSSSPSAPLRLTPSQFLDAIIRISNIKYLPSIPSSLALRVATCIEKDVLTGACRTVVDDFRQQMTSETVRNVFKANKGKLSALYRQYADRQPSGTNGSNGLLSLRLPQFLQLLTDAQLVHPESSAHLGLTAHRLELLFKNVQHVDDFLEIDSPPSHGLSYQEFLSSLGSLACWVVPDPFLSLSSKIEAFLERTLFVRLKQIITHRGEEE